MKEHLGVKEETLVVVLVFGGIGLNEFVVKEKSWVMGMVQE